jgi:hypothetical protein
MAGLGHLQPQAPAAAVERLSEGDAKLAGNVSLFGGTRSGALPERLLEELANVGEATYLIRIIVSIVNAIGTLILTAGPRMKAARFIRLGMLPIMSVLVILSPLFWVRQNSVRLGDLLETLTCLRSLVAVRMPLVGELSIRALDLLGIRCARHAQHFIIISHCRCHRAVLYRGFRAAAMPTRITSPLRSALRSR